MTLAQAEVEPGPMVRQLEGIEETVGLSRPPSHEEVHGQGGAALLLFPPRAHGLYCGSALLAGPVGRQGEATGMGHFC